MPYSEVRSLCRVLNAKELLRVATDLYYQPGLAREAGIDFLGHFVLIALTYTPATPSLCVSAKFVTYNPFTETFSLI